MQDIPTLRKNRLDKQEPTIVTKPAAHKLRQSWYRVRFTGIPVKYKQYPIFQKRHRKTLLRINSRILAKGLRTHTVGPCHEVSQRAVIDQVQRGCKKNKKNSSFCTYSQEVVHGNWQDLLFRDELSGPSCCRRTLRLVIGYGSIIARWLSRVETTNNGMHRV